MVCDGFVGDIIVVTRILRVVVLTGQGRVFCAGADLKA